jgi:dTDP-4-dehydrorhamnose 3,5-epimerase
MKLKNTSLPGIYLIELDVFRDERGSFQERFNEKNFRALGIPEFPSQFVTDHLSISNPRVLRGLHFQEGDAAQAKLVGVSAGRIWDVVVDLRESSPSYGKHFGVELNADKSVLIFIPKGFAHGFCVLGEEPAHVTYKVSEYYAPQMESGIDALDPDLVIAWPYSDAVLAPKDRALPRLKDYAPKSR